MSKRRRLQPSGTKPKTLTLSDMPRTKGTDRKHVLPWTPRSIFRTRLDIQQWNTAFDMARFTQYPKNYPLQLILDDICLDGLLTSQMENRRQPILAADFSLKNEHGETDKEQTKILKGLSAYKEYIKAIQNMIFFKYQLLEQSIVVNERGELDVEVTLIPRTNVVPQNGWFYTDYYDEANHVEYRTLSEFGTYILEFNQDNFGLVNKAVPHILFKRFAQSCWSELCEIYGIPPRVMKTNTADPQQLARAEQMMRDMGAAAWFIIDETETFEFAKGTDTNGDVYKNLTKLCNDEVSLLFSGAIIGQDTVNGNYSKEAANQEVQDKLVVADMAVVQDYFNKQIIPSLVRLGFLKPGLTFEFNPAENLTELWQMVKDAMPYMTFNLEWMKSKFNIDVTGHRNTTTLNDEDVDKNKAPESQKKGKPQLSHPGFFM